MDTTTLRNDDTSQRVIISEEEKPLLPPSSIPSSPPPLHPSQFPSFHDWYQHISQLDYETFCSLRQRPPLIQTPYSDISDQEDFAANYRRIIFLIYNAGVPLMLFIISAIGKLFFRSFIVAWGCFMVGLTVMLIGWAFFALAGRFEVDDFLRLHKMYLVWPVCFLFIGVVAVKVGGGDESDIGVIFFILGVVILLANLAGWLVSRTWLEKRIELWPPLDDVKFIA